jgi:MATE family multidrug resistance protein
LDGFAHAAEAMVGKAIGAKSQRDFIATCKSTSLWALITALLFSSFFFILQGQLLAFFTNMRDVIAIAENYYLCIIILPIIGVWGYQLDGIFIGAGKTRAMQYTMLLSVFAVFIPIWWIFQSYGNWGLWLAFCAFMLSRGLLLGAVFSYFQRHNLWINTESSAI